MRRRDDSSLRPNGARRLFIGLRLFISWRLPIGSLVWSLIGSSAAAWNARCLGLLAFVVLLGCGQSQKIRDLQRLEKMTREHAQEIEEAVQATDNKLPPETDQR